MHGTLRMLQSLNDPSAASQLAMKLLQMLAARPWQPRSQGVHPDNNRLSATPQVCTHLVPCLQDSALQGHVHMCLVSVAALIRR